MSPPGIELADVGMTFGEIAAGIRAIEGISLQIAPGSFTAIVGPSGCGKTTILKLIGGLVTATEGRIVIDGLAPTEARKAQLFSYAFQNPVLLPWLTVLGNVRLLAQAAGKPERSPAEDLLVAVGLRGFEHRYPGELSGGMRQRASIARALTLAPRYLLLDEPFGALDDLTRESLEDLLATTWATSGFGCALVTHNIGEAVYLADQVIVISDRPGSIKGCIQIDLPRPRTPEIRASLSFVEKVREVRAALA